MDVNFGYSHSSFFLWTCSVKYRGQWQLGSVKYRGQWQPGSVKYRGQWQLGNTEHGSKFNIIYNIHMANIFMD